MQRMEPSIFFFFFYAPGRPVCLHSCFSASPQISVLEAPEVTDPGRCGGGPGAAGCSLGLCGWSICAEEAQGGAAEAGACSEHP